MVRTKLYEDSCGALLKSAGAAEFRMAWNMTNQWRNQQLRRSHITEELISWLPEIKIKESRRQREKRMEESQRGSKIQEKNNREKIEKECNKGKKVKKTINDRQILC